MRPTDRLRKMIKEHLDLKRQIHETAQIRSAQERRNNDGHGTYRGLASWTASEHELVRESLTQIERWAEKLQIDKKTLSKVWQECITEDSLT